MPRFTPQAMAWPMIAPKAACAPNALEKMSANIAGTLPALAIITITAIRMKASAMNGTTTSAKVAMRLMPPKMISASTAATPRPIHSFSAPAPPTASQAPAPHRTLLALSAMALACTPGSSRPVAMTVATAKVTAYHFRPIAFSM